MSILVPLQWNVRDTASPSDLSPANVDKVVLEDSLSRIFLSAEFVRSERMIASSRTMAQPVISIC